MPPKKPEGDYIANITRGKNMHGSIAFFSRPANRARFCDLIRTGSTRQEACATLGIVYETYRRYRANNPDFAKMVADATDDAAEPVLQTMRTLGIQGDTAAARVYLTHTLVPERKTQQHEHIHRHEVTVEQLESVQQLEQVLLDRQLEEAPEEEETET